MGSAGVVGERRLVGRSEALPILAALLLGVHFELQAVGVYAGWRLPRYATRDNEKRAQRAAVRCALGARCARPQPPNLPVPFSRRDAGQADRTDRSSQGGPGVRMYSEAAVTGLTEASCAGTTEVDCIVVEVEITTGPDAGRSFVQEMPNFDTTPDFSIGQRVILSRVPANGTVESIAVTPCDFDPNAECTTVTLQLAETVGGSRTAEFELFPGQDAGLRDGQDVHVLFESDDTIVGVSPATVQSIYQYADSQRRPFLFGLILVFAIVVIAFARWRGAAALAGLAMSLVVVVAWLIPSLLEGNPPSWTALVAASAIAYLALYMSHGFTRTSTIALLGTVGALALTTLLSTLTVWLGSFTGFSSEESTR